MCRTSSINSSSFGFNTIGNLGCELKARENMENFVKMNLTQKLLSAEEDIHMKGVNYQLDTLLFGVTCGLLVAYYLRNTGRTKHVAGPYPPGPRGVPILGYLPFLGSHPHKTFTELRRKYGDVMQLYMGSARVVVLHGKDTIREALVGECHAFSGRPRSVFGDCASDGNSIAFSPYTAQCRLQRRLISTTIMQTVRHHDQPLSLAVSQVARDLAYDLASAEQPVQPFVMIQEAVLEVGCKFLFGSKSSTATDDLRKEISKIFIKMTDAFAAVQIVDLIPWTKMFMSTRVQNLKDATTQLDAVVKRRAMQCLDDALLPEAADHWGGAVQSLHRLSLQSKEQLHAFGLEPLDLMSNVADLLGGGYETGGTLLLWFVLYMAHYPEVQKRIHAELKALGGKELTGEDRHYLPYTEASVLEVARHVSITPLSIPRSTTEDSNIGGFHIEKGTTVFPNLSSINWDKATWHDPELYSPERFLSEDRTALDQSVVDRLCLFGMGKRRCVGERLARVHLFLLIAGLMSHISVKTSPLHPSCLTDSEVLLTQRPHSYHVIIERLNQQYDHTP